MTVPSNLPEYNPNIPLRDQNIPESQENFLGNFTTLYDAFLRNHIALDDPTNPGNHDNIQLKEQKDKLSTGSQEISVYSKKVDGQTTQVFMRYGANGKEFQVTNFQIYPIPRRPKQQAYISFLPGGIMVYFGKVFAVGQTSAEININPPVSNNIMGVNLAGIDVARAQPNVSVVSRTTGFYTQLLLTSAGPMSDQYYLFFANL